MLMFELAVYAVITGAFLWYVGRMTDVNEKSIQDANDARGFALLLVDEIKAREARQANRGGKLVGPRQSAALPPLWGTGDDSVN